MRVSFRASTTWWLVGQGTLGYTLVASEVPAGAPPTTPRPPTWVEAQLSLRLPVLGQALDSKLGRSQQTSALYLALGNRAAEIDFVLMVGIDGDQLMLQLLDARTESLSAPRMVPIGEDASAAAASALPQLLELVGENDRLTQTVGAAVPLDVGTNSRLAQMLLLPRDFKSQSFDRGKRRRRGLIAGITTAVVVGVVAVGATYVVVTQP